MFTGPGPNIRFCRHASVLCSNWLVPFCILPSMESVFVCFWYVWQHFSSSCTYWFTSTLRSHRENYFVKRWQTELRFGLGCLEVLLKQPTQSTMTPALSSNHWSTAVWTSLIEQHHTPLSHLWAALTSFASRRQNCGALRLAIFR